MAAQDAVCTDGRLTPTPGRGLRGYPVRSHLRPRASMSLDSEDRVAGGLAVRCAHDPDQPPLFYKARQKGGAAARAAVAGQ